VRNPKERALIELLHDRRARGRRVLVYVTHTQKRDITPPLTAILSREGFRVAVLKADTVAPVRREEWVAARAREGIDALVVHPRLVQTGLDLVDFPSVCWYEVDYSVYVMRQASRRSWRIGQHLPVDVTFFAYAGTLQAEALGLVAAKMRSALMVEGELPEDGLAALEGDTTDVLLAFARRLVTPDTAAAPLEVDALDALFSQAREAAAGDEEYLVEGHWSDGAPESPFPAATITQREDQMVAQGQLWQQVSADTVDQSSDANRSGHHAERAQDALAPVGVPAPVARMMSLDALARLVQQPRRRVRPVPAGQLTLFEADTAA